MTTPIIKITSYWLRVSQPPYPSDQRLITKIRFEDATHIIESAIVPLDIDPRAHEYLIKDNERAAQKILWNKLCPGGLNITKL